MEIKKKSENHRKQVNTEDEKLPTNLIFKLIESLYYQQNKTQL